MTTTALAGRRVVLTRAVEDCAGWAARLAELGAHPVIFPCIEARLIDTPALRSAVAEAAANADWLVFTSRRGVDAFVELGGRPGPGCRLAAVGPRTADAIEEALYSPSVVGSGTAAALAGDLLDDENAGPESRVALAVAENAGTAIEDRLTAAGVRVTRLNVYRTEPAAPNASRAGEFTSTDVVWFASPSAVTGFVNLLDGAAPAGGAPVCIAIGPSTASALVAHGFDVAAQAREPSLEGLLEAMQCLS